LCSTADAGNNACGFGFNGYDSNGKELWNRITNVNALEVEVSVENLSFRIRITIFNDVEKRRKLIDKDNKPFYSCVLS